MAHDVFTIYTTIYTQLLFLRFFVLNRKIILTTHMHQKTIVINYLNDISRRVGTLKKKIM